LVQGPINHKQQKLNKSDLIGKSEDGSFQNLAKVWDLVKNGKPVPEVLRWRIPPEVQEKRHGKNRVFLRGVGGSRTRDGGFAIRCLSHLATTPYY
jgi:hypothetical protein